ncbi:MAG: tRNA (adenosine(37)-N6)-threonylcarbamoyltransferase complex ATPase subunit type 1 TsaE [Coriobacteriales bacterium]|nr:tRNA (adenosine(37)-N6)-threonylcarbamoyltransferase complex ATPase subunit type 1 TsaE [Coriobacteriales bacterium]
MTENDALDAQALPLRAAKGVYKSLSAEATRCLGRILGEFLMPGDVVILGGDLGAGKTCFTGGVAQSLGDADPVTSPTFAVVQVHDTGRIPLYHADVYRLEDASRLEDTGIYDLLEADGVCIIEWGDMFIDEFGDERLDIMFSRNDVSAQGLEPARTLEFYPHGTRARDLLEDFDARVTDVCASRAQAE